MSDGNTGHPMAPVHTPVTQEELSTMQNLLTRAASAIVDAAGLTQALADLRREFEALKSEIDYVRRQNKDLDDMLGMVRQQRDEAQRQRDELQITVDRQSREIGEATAKIEDQSETIERLVRSVDTLRAESDDNFSRFRQAETNYHNAVLERDASRSELTNAREKIEGLERALAEMTRDRDDCSTLAVNYSNEATEAKRKLKEASATISSLAALFKEPEPVPAPTADPVPAVEPVTDHWWNRNSA